MRIGRGNSAGGGTTGGRGTKGQKSRSGRGTIRGFEGGQLRMIKGLPMKRGFTNNFKTDYALVMLTNLEQFNSGERISLELLRERGILRDKGKPVKVLGDGELTKAVTVVAHKFTRSARQKIEAAGGTVEEI
jgi:large subunit ribosomal protein L15